MIQLLPSKLWIGRDWLMLRGNFLVLDFEATCWNENPRYTDGIVVPVDEMEIIEIGALIINQELETISSFSQFIRPVRHPLLSQFCQELTTITQEQVAQAPGFKEVAAELAFWAADHDVNWWGSWGKYDRKQLSQDVSYHQLPDPLDYPHYNLKELFSQQQGLKRRLGLQGALKLAKLEFQGTPHRAISDTENIARLLPWILGENVLDGSRRFSSEDIEEGRVK